MCLKRCFIVTTEIFNYRWCQNNLCRSTIEQMSCQKCSGNISPKNLVKYKYIVVFINKMKPICRIFLTFILPDHNNNVLKIGLISLYEASYFLFYMLMFLTASSGSSTNCVNDFLWVFLKASGGGVEQTDGPAGFWIVCCAVMTKERSNYFHLKRNCIYFGTNVFLS